jgi:hypothetical protein
MGVEAGWKAFDDAVVRASIVGEFENVKAGVDKKHLDSARMGDGKNSKNWFCSG